MVRFRFLLRELVARDLKSRYAGSLLGFLWAFVHPLWQLALFSFVFAYVLRVPLVGERASSFPVFLFAGLLPWLAVQEGISRSTTVVSENSNLVKKLRFPSALLVLAVVLGSLAHQGVALGVFAAIQVGRGELALAGLPGLAFALLAQTALTFGLGLAAAALQVYFRDVAQLVGIALSAWFYLTPVVYPIGLVPAPLRGGLLYNPLAAVVGLYRAALVGGDSPPVGALAALAGSAAATVGLGWLVFRRLSPGFSDEL
jgi:ABC-type polysaccharide/polyol phosphate export permease